MTPPTPNLARRAVACRGWRWMPGMRTVEVLRPPPFVLPLWDEAVVVAADDGDPVSVCTVHRKVRDLHPGALPDLSDPATLGCMLALVREAWAAPFAQVSPRLGGNPTVCDGWVCYLNDDEADRRFSGATEAEALIAALEAAPPAGGAP